ncbi:hypothetical protein RRU94_18330 [Domibacillus sp. DTU_2020_1001157_1_SI_ALB_TIR_016]|uniref:hypothetical protein n=1 Tax=Domibacillus sp. DTU_2020_1001157_1_SI_ALB_TIR_016 TaxID=3077789 RepID=UPI0028EC0169|nr:hypothetical protein [Domibacillus sp. DTU_2020_1001157_1_SI_ALB_TIR_016]WNS79486.1 hypothetical protein RRU94_18330 [Domibacillus sp. DTU_2020_1001157_1_SI_ALB_TIR_016]
MKTLLKLFIGLALLVALLGAGLYYFGTKIASDKIMDEVAQQIENSGEVEQIKEQINNNPELKKLVEEGANADTSSLPFTTKEEAAREMVKKFSPGELKYIQSTVQGGLTEEKKQALLETLQSKLTEDEIQALKVLAYKELYQ